VVLRLAERLAERERLEALRLAERERLDTDFFMLFAKSLLKLLRTRLFKLLRTLLGIDFITCLTNFLEALRLEAERERLTDRERLTLTLRFDLGIFIYSILKIKKRYFFHFFITRKLSLFYYFYKLPFK